MLAFHCVKSLQIQSYLVQMQENADQNKSESGHFSRSGFWVSNIQRLDSNIHDVCVRIPLQTEWTKSLFSILIKAFYDQIYDPCAVMKQFFRR